MSNVLEELTVPLEFDAQNFGSGIEGAIAKASTLGTFLGNMASNLISGAFDLLGQGIQKLEGFLADTVAEAGASQDAIAQLEQVIKSTGGAAGITSQQAQELASSLQKVTKYSDETILGGENLLLTFTSIGKDVFPKATETILDMSQALGQDLKSSAIQLGKALQDPISGITALRRVGVNFTDAQQEMINKLVEAGDIEKAQTLILDELQKEFGGSAVAAGQTFGGQVEILKNKLSDLKERIGGPIMDVLGALGTRFNTLIDSPQVQSLIDKVIGGLDHLGEKITGWVNSPEFSKFLDGVLDGLSKTTDFIETNLPIWEEKFNNFLKTLGNVSDWFNATFPDAQTNFLGNMKGVTDFINSEGNQSFTGLNDLLTNLKKTLDLIETVLGLVGIKFSFSDTAAGIFTNTILVLLNPLFQIAQTWDDLNKLIAFGNQIWNAAISRVSEFIGYIQTLKSLLERLSLPDWLTPGSPTPLENALRGINSAFTDINNKSLASFSGGINMNNATPASSAAIDYSKLAKVLALELAKVTN